MFSSHNAERARQGLAPFRVDGTLAQVARQRAQDMASKGYFSHTSPSGQTAFGIMNALGYRYLEAGENIARNNYPDSQTVSVAMSALMNSATHRENILDTGFYLVGIGEATSTDGMKYFAIEFAR